MKNETPARKSTRARSTSSPTSAARSRRPRAARRSAAGANGPTAADIAKRAYEIYLSRQGAPGDPMSDWLQAEAELRSRSVRSE
jgi:hypothetical protein